MKKDLIKITIIFLLSVCLIASYNYKTAPKKSQEKPVPQLEIKPSEQESPKQKTFDINVKKIGRAHV